MGIERSYKCHHENKPGDIEIRPLTHSPRGTPYGGGRRLVTQIRVADNADRMKYPGFPVRDKEREREALWTLLIGADHPIIDDDVPCSPQSHTSGQISSSALARLNRKLVAQVHALHIWRRIGDNQFGPHLIASEYLVGWIGTKSSDSQARVKLIVQSTDCLHSTIPSPPSPLGGRS